MFPYPVTPGQTRSEPLNLAESSANWMGVHVSDDRVDALGSRQENSRDPPSDSTKLS
ncbi:hypothetical protein K7432_013695 [Basidiobolus ranarum]|uniref:Uncharacterized protein n=1 Tax=Basidiobolus ranarum TaxID=34480 RepID=A0ABR2WIT5_9FUNG